MAKITSPLFVKIMPWKLQIATLLPRRWLTIDWNYTGLNSREEWVEWYNGLSDENDFEKDRNAV